MKGRKLLVVALIAVTSVSAGVVVVRAVQGTCRWGTFAYLLGVQNPDSQEDRRADAAVLIEGKETVVTENHHATDVALSPDGTQVVVTSAIGLNGNEYTNSKPTGLYIHDVDGSDVRLLTRPGGYQPEWSPDGETIAFMREGAIFTARVDDGETHEIYRLPESKAVDPPYLSYMTWSGDSRRIAFFIDDHGFGGIGGLYTMRADGSGVQRVSRAEGGDLAWSPDGRWFAFEDSYKGVPSLMLAEASGGKATQIEPFAYMPFWSRDGRQLAYVIGHEGHYAPRIVIGDADGSNAKAIPVDRNARGGTSIAGWASCS